MIPLQERVLQTIRRESLIASGDRVLVALSGGADSVALTRLLSELAETASFKVVGVVHLNHQLREAADADERFCRMLAGRLSLSCLVDRVDVTVVANRESISTEAAGHRERYAFFQRAAATLQADCVATAHTRDDQAETYLLRLLRGAGPAGLSGIHPRSGDVVRPLLDVSTSELREYLSAHGQEFREDETNRDVTVTRNRIRHELVPFLERQFSPSVVDVLVRETKIARYDSEWLEHQATAAASEIVKYTGRCGGCGSRGTLASTRSLGSTHRDACRRTGGGSQCGIRPSRSAPRDSRKRIWKSDGSRSARLSSDDCEQMLNGRSAAASTRSLDTGDGIHLPAADSGRS